VNFVDRDETVLDGDQPASVQLGDTNGWPGRVAAGSASAVGGLRSGDSFPHSPPYVRQREPTPAQPYPPWIIWEGDLVQGDHALAITPSLWEWDGGMDAFHDWVAWALKATGVVKEEVKKYTKGGTVADSVIGSIEAGFGLALSLQEDGVLGQAKDRPIGMVESSPATDPRTYVFDPKTLVLNYDRAEALLRTSLLGVPGLRAFRFTDDPRLRGDYTLYLRVERLGPALELKPDVVAPAAPTTVASAQRSLISLRWRATDPDIVRAERTGTSNYDVLLERIAERGLRTRVIALTRTTKVSVTRRLRPGIYAFSARARDGAGNVSPWSRSRIVRVK
jgi:hypothetical protein